MNFASCAPQSGLRRPSPISTEFRDFATSFRPLDEPESVRERERERWRERRRERRIFGSSFGATFRNSGAVTVSVAPNCGARTRRRARIFRLDSSRFSKEQQQKKNEREKSTKAILFSSSSSSSSSSCSFSFYLRNARHCLPCAVAVGGHWSAAHRTTTAPIELGLKFELGSHLVATSSAVGPRLAPTFFFVVVVFFIQPSFSLGCHGVILFFSLRFHFDDRADDFVWNTVRSERRDIFEPNGFRLSS